MAVGTSADIRQLLKRMPYTVRVGDAPGGLSEFVTIQAAIDYANSQGPTVNNQWTVQIWSGLYDAENLTWRDYVNLKGMGPPGSVRIIRSDAANPIASSGVTCEIEGITIQNTNAGAPAVRVTGGVLTLRNCDVSGTGAGDAIQMTGGTLNIYDCIKGVGDIDLSTAACILNIYRSRLTTDPIDTAGAFAHALTLENCDLGGQNIASAATLATTLAMRNCANVGTVTNAGTGIFTIQESHVASVNQSNAAGAIRISGGTLLACAGATGPVTWKSTALTYRVIVGMVVQHAITAAVADAPAPAATGRYTVVVHPGDHTGQVVMTQYVDVVSVGGKYTTRLLFTATADSQQIVDMVANCKLKGFYISGDVTNFSNLSGVRANAISGWVVEDCEGARSAGGVVFRCFYTQGANCNGTFIRCSSDTSNIGRSGIYVGHTSGTVTVINCPKLDGNEYGPIGGGEEGTGTVDVRDTAIVGGAPCFVAGFTLNAYNCYFSGLNLTSGTINLYNSYFSSLIYTAGTINIYGNLDTQTWQNINDTTVGFGATRYALLNYGGDPLAAEANAQIVVPRAGRLGRLYVRVTANTLDGATVATARVNGVDTALTLSVAAGATGTFTDNNHYVAVAAGDLVSVSLVAAGTLGAITVKQVSLVIV